MEMKLTDDRAEKLQSIPKTRSVKGHLISAVRLPGREVVCPHTPMSQTGKCTYLSHPTSPATGMRHGHLSISSHSGGTLGPGSSRLEVTATGAAETRRPPQPGPSRLDRWAARDQMGPIITRFKARNET